MAVQFFGETGPIRVPYRLVRTSDPDEEMAIDPRENELPSRGKQVSIGKRLPKHRATTTNRAFSQ